MDSKTKKIRELNDNLRKTYSGGKLIITQGFASLPIEQQVQIMAKIREFNKFTPDNDPYGEHDFGAIEHHGDVYFWKIDYYDPDYQYLSPDPSDPNVTNRVLTVMLADEY